MTQPAGETSYFAIDAKRWYEETKQSDEASKEFMDKVSESTSRLSFLLKGVPTPPNSPPSYLRRGIVAGSIGVAVVVAGAVAVHHFQTSK